MKRLFFFIAALVLLINVLPILILKIVQPIDIDIDLSSDKTVRVWHHEKNKAVVMPIDEYLVGVVAAEMPAAFPIEALKAQAIAARTYAINKAQLASDIVNPNHKEADVCTSSLHCQAWISEEEQNKKWGTVNAILYRKKIQEAIQATKGLVLTYESKLIDPVYHSTCGGHTEEAGEVWQYDPPYLKSVPCDYCKDSPKYRSTAEFSLKQLDKLLKTKISKTSSLRRLISSPIKITERTKAGYVKTIKIGDKKFSGTEVRTKLNLNSANFTTSLKKDKIVFNVKGYGHGVGLCQFGAGGMAKEGKNYEEILQYYYQGVKIIKAY